MLKLYALNTSGNCYKIKLLLHLLDLEYEWINTNSLKGETRTPEFLEKNPNGKIPVLELENGELLSESGAILFYLAKDSEFLPKDHLNISKVLQWMFFEQYSYQQYIGFNRRIIHLLKQRDNYIEKINENFINGYKALDVLEKHLSDKNYFVGEKYTIADIALYAYTHIANEGEFDLSKYKNINLWLKNIESHPKHITMLG